jgi:hypothetical protein
MIATAMAAFPAASASGQALPWRAGLTSELSVAPLKGAIYIWELYAGTPEDFAAVAGTCPDDGACFADGNNNSPTVRIRWLRPGVYFYKTSIITAGGCTNFKVGRIEVSDLSGTGHSPEFLLTSGTSADGMIRFRIRLQKSSAVIIELFTAAGQLVERIGGQTVEADVETVIPVSARLPQGIYLYRILTESESVSGRVAVVPVY